MGKHHSMEYKEYVAKLVVEDGRKGTDVAYDLGLHVSTVNRWVQTYKKKHATPQSEMPMTQSEAEALKKRNQDLEEELEILKKAMHIFTQNPK